MENLFMRFPGGRDRALTFSYDDGVQTDVRFISILQKNGLKGTFNINTGIMAPEGTVYPAGTILRRMSRSEVLAAYADSGMEVATHTSHHLWINQLPTHQIVAEILRDRMEAEAMFGGIIDGSAYPYGVCNPEIKLALRACGIVYCRSGVQTCQFGLPSDWLEWAGTCHHNNEKLFDLGEKFLKTPVFRTQPGLFYVWGHTYEFDEFNNWERIEQFAAQMGGHADRVWYATNHEIYDYITAYRALRFSCDGHTVYNPTATVLYFMAENTPVTINPGETKQF